MDLTTQEPRKRHLGPWHQQMTWDWKFQTDGSQPCQALPLVWEAETREDTALAVRWCKECPFLQRCRLEGLVNVSAPLAGVWGGLTPQQIHRRRVQPDYIARTRVRAEMEARRERRSTWTA